MPYRATMPYLAYMPHLAHMHTADPWCAVAGMVTGMYIGVTSAGRWVGLAAGHHPPLVVAAAGATARFRHHSTTMAVG